MYTSLLMIDNRQPLSLTLVDANDLDRRVRPLTHFEHGVLISITCIIFWSFVGVLWGCFIVYYSERSAVTLDGIDSLLYNQSHQIVRLLNLHLNNASTARATTGD